MIRESFIFYSSFLQGLDTIQDDSERLKAYEYISHYSLKGEEPEPDDGVAYTVFLLIKPQIDANNKRYLDGCKGGRKPKEKTSGSEIQKPVVSEKTKIKKPNVNDNDNVNDNEKENVNENKNNIILKNDTETEVSEYGNKEINNFIFLLKEECNKLGVAYDKQKERQFTKNILTAKEYGEFCEKVGQDRIEFSLNILRASIKINYRKGICSGPMKIYMNYTDVYNETIKLHNKNSRNLIQSF